MNRRKLKQQGSSDHVANPGELRVWQHPTIVNIIQALEVFSLDPGDGKLAASLDLTFDQLAGCFRNDRSRPKRCEAQLQTALGIRDSAFGWFEKQAPPMRRDLDPRRVQNRPNEGPRRSGEVAGRRGLFRTGAAVCDRSRATAWPAASVHPVHAQLWRDRVPAWAGQ